MPIQISIKSFKIFTTNQSPLLKHRFISQFQLPLSKGTSLKSLLQLKEAMNVSLAGFFASFICGFLIFGSVDAEYSTVWQTQTILTDTEIALSTIVSTQQLTSTQRTTQLLTSVLAPTTKIIKKTSTVVVPTTVYKRTWWVTTNIIMNLDEYYKYNQTTLIIIPTSTHNITKTLNLEAETTTYFFTSNTVPVTTAPSLLFCYNLV